MCNAQATGDVGLIPGSGRFPEGGHGNPFYYSSLENTMDGGAWWATVHGIPGGSEVKASTCNVGDLGLIPGLGRSPGEGNGNPLQ